YEDCKVTHCSCSESRKTITILESLCCSATSAFRLVRWWPGTTEARRWVVIQIGQWKRVLRLQFLRMPMQMVAHEGRNEVIAVVISRLASQRQRDIGLAAGGLQQFRLELLLEEIIGLADVDQEAGKLRAVLDQRHRVVAAPIVLVRPEIAGQRLDAPGHLRGR